MLNDEHPSQHAKNMCIGYASSNTSDFNRTYFLNKIESDKHINTTKFSAENFKFYMDKTVDD